jgi:hypothetical protein
MRHPQDQKGKLRRNAVMAALTEDALQWLAQKSHRLPFLDDLVDKLDLPAWRGAAEGRNGRP